MKLFVTGMSSFIGRRAVEIFRERGCEVHGMDLAPHDENCVNCDLNSPELADAIPEGTNAVVHLAAISRDNDCRADLPYALQVNIQGTANVIEAAAKRCVNQIIFASSEWVYGQTASETPQLEEDPIDISRLDSEYAMTKAVGEQLLRQAVQRGDLMAATILRFGIVYGPRMQNWSAVESLFHTALTDQPIEVGSARTARRFIYVDDICTAIHTVAGRPGCETFNVAGNELLTLGRVVEASGHVTGKQITLKEKAPDNFNVRNPASDKIQSVTDWRPSFSIVDGLTQLMSYFHQQEVVANG